jgi:hypothetical protein
VLVNGDTDFEKDEVFLVGISNPVNGEIVQASAPAPSSTTTRHSRASSPSAPLPTASTKNGGQATITVTRTAAATARCPSGSEQPREQRWKKKTIRAANAFEVGGWRCRTEDCRSSDYQQLG